MSALFLDYTINNNTFRISSTVKADSDRNPFVDKVCRISEHDSLKFANPTSKQLAINTTKKLINLLTREKDSLLKIRFLRKKELSHRISALMRALQVFKSIEFPIPTVDITGPELCSPPSPHAPLPSKIYSTRDDLQELLDAYGFSELPPIFKEGLISHMLKRPLHLTHEGAITLGSEAREFNSLLLEFLVDRPNITLICCKHPKLLNYLYDSKGTSLVPADIYTNSANTLNDTVSISSRETALEVLHEIGLNHHLNPQLLKYVATTLAEDNLVLEHSTSILSSRTNKIRFIGFFLRMIVKARQRTPKVDWDATDKFYINCGELFAKILNNI